MKHEGRGVIRLNDKTDHGGKVTSASSKTKVMGIAAAIEGDMTFCPACRGNFPISRMARARSTRANHMLTRATSLNAART